MNTVQKLRGSGAFLWGFAKRREFSILGTLIKSALWGEEQSIGCSWDSTVPHAKVSALMPLSLRSAREEDLDRLLTTEDAGLEDDDRRERLVRQHMRTLGFKHCMVVVNDQDDPCFLQWLILPSENALLAEAYRGLYPPLESQQALVEGAYIPPAFRGMKVMPAAKLLICEYATTLGVAEVITFVSATNIASQKGCQRAGFKPIVTRTSLHRLGRRQLIFESLPSGTPYPFEVVSARPAA